jgi:hypothetical protein
MKYILSKNKHDFLRWCRDAGHEAWGAVFIQGRQDLLGRRISSDDIVLLNGWRSNPNYDEEFIAAYNVTVDASPTDGHPNTKN